MSSTKHDYSVRLTNWNKDRQALCDIRRKVFIEEQQVPEELEWDDLDEDCIHVLATGLNGTTIGTARMTSDGHIGRMAVLPEWRRHGVGGAMLQLLLSESRQRGLYRLHLNAQIQATGFYKRFGFETEGEIFMDAGIPHIKMFLHILRKHGEDR